MQYLSVVKRLKCKRRRAQTILEYFMMIAVFVLPVAAVVNSLLKDSGEGKKDNVMQNITKNAYGDGDRMGIIGRPYP